MILHRRLLASLVLPLAVLSACSKDSASGANSPYPVPQLIALPKAFSTGLEDIAELPDGELVALIYWDSKELDPTFARCVVARYTATGALDTSFGTNGTSTIQLGTQKRTMGCARIAVQSDGKILLSGSTINFESDSQVTAGEGAYLLRLNEDGSIDTDFGRSGIAFAETDNGRSIPGADQVAVLDSGKILLSVTAITSGYRAGLARFNDDGSPDRDYGASNDTGVSEIHAMPANGSSSANPAFRVLPDGKVIAAAEVKYTEASGGKSDIVAMRYDSDGHLDPTFGTDGSRIYDLGYDHEQMRGVAVDASGSYYFNAATLDLDVHSTILKTNVAGVPDASFGTAGISTPSYSYVDRFGATQTNQGMWGNSIALLPSGKLLLLGELYRDFMLAVVGANGALDTSFWSGVGYAKADPHNAAFTYDSREDQMERILVRADGSWFTWGRTRNDPAGDTSFSGFVTKFTASGAFDTTFGAGGVKFVKADF